MIYVLREGERGPFKIGYIQDHARLKARVKALSAGNSKPLNVVATFPGGPRTEWRLHDTFARHHIREGWFRPAAGVKRLVAEGARADFDAAAWIVRYEEAVERLEKVRRKTKRERLREQIERGEVTVRYDPELQRLVT